MPLQETWLLSEFCDKGNLDRALSGGRFHDKASGKPEMVRSMRCACCLHAQAACIAACVAHARRQHSLVQIGPVSIATSLEDLTVVRNRSIRYARAQRDG